MCARQSTDEIQAALLLGNASMSGQKEVGVSMHDHIAPDFWGLGSAGYQQNACFEISPKIPIKIFIPRNAANSSFVV